MKHVSQKQFIAKIQVGATVYGVRDLAFLSGSSATTPSPPVWTSRPISPTESFMAGMNGSSFSGHGWFGVLRHEVAHVAVEPEQFGLNPMFCHRYPTRTCV